MVFVAYLIHVTMQQFYVKYSTTETRGGILIVYMEKE
jgi:hypothetical protein